jgi:hypothetical protein
MQRKDLPDRIIAVVPGLPRDSAKDLADLALAYVRLRSPKLSGESSRKMEAIHGEGWIGIRWHDDYIWYQENGIRPFTMFALAGKTIPMWIDDPTGYERKKNPKARTRTTESGKVQVLIFRRAAKSGARKTVRKRVGGQWITTEVPASFPGAPGRIAMRGPGGRILSPDPSNRHIGVRWRNPGLRPRKFIHYSIIDALRSANIANHMRSIYPTNRSPVIGV